MNEPRTGQRVITDHGDGLVTTITAGDADTNILRYRVTSGTKHGWYYLDEIIAIADPVTVAR